MEDHFFASSLPRDHDVVEPPLLYHHAQRLRRFGAAGPGEHVSGTKAPFARCTLAGEPFMQSLPTILVVEDQLIQPVVKETRTEGGFKIDIASSAAQAIELLDKAGGKYRALVTDINLGRG
jgi:hypothetical protein